MKRALASLREGFTPLFVFPVAIGGTIGCLIGCFLLVHPAYSSFATVVLGLICLSGLYLDKPPPLAEEKPKFSDDQRAFSQAMLKEIQDGIVSFDRQVQATVRGGKVFFVMSGVVLSSQFATSPIPKGFLLFIATTSVGIAVAHLVVLPRLSRKGELFFRQVRERLREANDRAKTISGLLKNRSSSADWSQYNPSLKESH